MVIPSMRALDPRLARAARSIAERVRSLGHRAWLVGGAVRDLALERRVQDVDMAAAARPEAIEAAFPRTSAIGRSFGTIQVRVDDVPVELTTFRSDSGYGDRRRPDRVAYGRTLEEDARRRDFTCNALYLDPLSDELRDPEGGLADLEARHLRCVGEARARFREDGLRLLRMARFAGSLDLEIDAATLAAARGEADSLVGVSAERVVGELRRAFSRPGGARAVEVLLEAGLYERILPPLPDARISLEALRELDEAPGPVLALSLLLDPDPALEREEEGVDPERLGGLRLSGGERAGIAALWRLRREWSSIAGADPPAPRSRLIRAVRSERWADAVRLELALRSATGRDPQPILRLRRDALALAPEELRPEPLLSARDLAELGLSPGPLWGRLLAEAETAQLDGALTDRAQAVRWLGERVGGEAGR